MFQPTFCGSLRATRPLSSLIAVAFLAVSACGGPQAAVAAKEPQIQLSGRHADAKLDKAGEGDRYVLVQRGAWLHAQPGEGGVRARDAAFRLVQRDPGAVVSYRLVEDKGEWLAIESLPETDMKRHCVRPESALTGIALRLFVHRADVLDVVSRGVRMIYSDGTSVALAAGVAVGNAEHVYGAHSPPLWPLAVDGLRMRTTLPGGATGLSYQAGSHFDTSPSGARMAPTARLIFANGEPVVVSDTAARLHVYDKHIKPRGQLVTLRTRCGEYVMLAPHDAMVEGSDEEAGVVSGSGARKGCWRAKDGAKFFWPDGSEAGKAVGGATMGALQTGEPDATRLCFEHPLRLYWPPGTTPTPDANLPLCADRASLESLCDKPAAAPTQPKRP